MNKCLCILAMAGLLAGCRAPYNFAELRFDRTRLAAALRQADEAPANEEPAPAAEDELKTAAHHKSEDSDRSALIELASAREPDDSIAENLRRGHAAASAGELDTARASYERVLAVEPKHVQANHRLAVLADQRRDYEAAARHYMAALQQEPGSADLLNDIGYSFFLQGRLETAQRYLEDAVRAQPSHTRAKANLALVRKRAELIASANSAATAAEPAATPAADPSEWLHEQVAKTPPQGAVTAHQRESAYPPESPNPVQTVAGESAPGIATLRPALPKIRPHNSETDIATDLFTPVVTPFGKEREPAPAIAAQQVRVPVPPLPAPPAQPAGPTAFPVSLRSPLAVPPSDDVQPDSAAPLAVPPSREPLITPEVARRSARYVGMNTGPGNPFSALDPNRLAEVPPVALTPGDTPGALLAAASPMTAPRVRITGVSVVPESAQPQPHHAASGITLASNSQPAAGHDPIEQFQREVQQYHAQRNEIDLRREGSVMPAGGTFPSTDGIRHASWPEAVDEPHWPQAPATRSDH